MLKVQDSQVPRGKPYCPLCFPSGTTLSAEKFMLIFSFLVLGLADRRTERIQRGIHETVEGLRNLDTKESL